MAAGERGSANKEVSKMKGSQADGVTYQPASSDQLSKGAEKVLSYLQNLEGEAKISELETVLKAVPIMDENSLDSIIDALESLNKVKRTENTVKIE